MSPTTWRFFISGSTPPVGVGSKLLRSNTFSSDWPYAFTSNPGDTILFFAKRMDALWNGDWPTATRLANRPPFLAAGERER